MPTSLLETVMRRLGRRLAVLAALLALSGIGAGARLVWTRWIQPQPRVVVVPEPSSVAFKPGTAARPVSAPAARPAAPVTPATPVAATPPGWYGPPAPVVASAAAAPSAPQHPGATSPTTAVANAPHAP